MSRCFGICFAHNLKNKKQSQDHRSPAGERADADVLFCHYRQRLARFSMLILYSSGLAHSSTLLGGEKHLPRIVASVSQAYALMRCAASKSYFKTPKCMARTGGP